MKQSLQVKMGQQLAMTPQLQQAIRLLQLSTLELQHEIQETLESNPMLESETVQENDSLGGSEEKGDLIDFSEPYVEEKSPEMAVWTDNIPNELSVDVSWGEVYTGLSSKGSDDDYDPLLNASSLESLQDQLEWQLDMANMSDRDRLIGLAIIDAINPVGYLSCTLDDLFASLQSRLDDLDFEEVKVLQHRIQQFYPVGCGCMDLRECLLVQLNQLPSSTPHLNNAKTVINSHLDSLGVRDYTRVMRRARLKEGDLREVMSLIKSLNPKPGIVIDSTKTEYVIPDISVRKLEGQWVAELNANTLPKLRINTSYASMIQRANKTPDNLFMKSHLQEAKWFLKNLQSRNETLMKVACQIIVYQQDFFEHGDEAMKPLVLTDIAEAIGMHESTISRVTNRKYMHTPRGVYELKYFFSSHVSTVEGGECSSTAIRAHIRKLIAAEAPRKPLSDNKMAKILGEQGINVARRTIAKYRESMNIPSSNERKQLLP